MSDSESRSLRCQVEEAIKTKIDILKKWRDEQKIPWRLTDTGVLERDADGELILDHFPASPSAFADWDGRLNCAYNRKTILAHIRAISRATLYKKYHTELQSEVEELTHALRKIGHRQILEANKATQIQRVLAERDELLAISQQQRSEILRYRVKIYAEEAASRKNQMELENANGELQRRIEILEERNAELVATLNRLTPFEVKKEKE